jgi:prepilin-type N-terminal cleavage/methylation domain-containing protein
VLEILMSDGSAMTRHQGFTLVELIVTIAVAAILLTIAVPSFLDSIDRARVVGAADNLLADMRYAQAEAMKTNVSVVVTFTAGTSWAYSMNTTPAKTSSVSDYRGSSLAISTAVVTAGNVITFIPRRNTIEPTPAAAERMVTITSERGRVLCLEVTPESAMRLCTTSGLPGYPACS